MSERDDFDDLISDAWDVLRANADIVQFIGCVLHGGLDNLGACLERILNPSWMPGGGLVGVTRTVVVEPVSSLGNLLQVNYDLDPQRSTIFVKEKIHCDNYIDRLADPTTSPQDRECMTVDFAALLVHELVHCCGPEIMFADTTRGQPMPGQRFPPAGAEVSTCSASYMMENAFRFFMKRRYPELGTGTDCTSVGMSCCQDWDSPCILFLDTFHRWNAPVLGVWICH